MKKREGDAGHVTLQFKHILRPPLELRLVSLKRKLSPLKGLVRGEYGLFSLSRDAGIDGRDPSKVDCAQAFTHEEEQKLKPYFSSWTAVSPPHKQKTCAKANDSLFGSSKFLSIR
ncbi:hypothetical protein AXG93_606s1030 [Marchantia polymorpha subsp. ruderalis]|uniref:Uncharacterized protein n=1 Tax=Marchantia polymorpha subsp. ruderalis TaxID=1480154 RepID=A0A176VJA2_MARPO|nr:hypothetical protein AXG93_606s1030 [Marchantia polymorpha subsp. ruderalis]